MRHTTPTIVVAVALLALTGCSNTEPGKADAAPAPKGSDNGAPLGDGAVPDHGAPRIDSALDTTAFQQAPCTVLTADQVTELLGSGVNGKPDVAGDLGPTCQWAKDQSAAQIDLAFPNLDDRGLTSLYGAMKAGSIGFLEELRDASGHPVIAYGLADRSMSAGICSVRVGTSDRATIDIAISLSAENVGKTDPCEAGRDIAEMVIGNIKGGN